MTVRELELRISGPELAEWMAYHSISPFGEFRADFRAGVIASTIANVMAGKKGKPFVPADFMPLQEGEEKSDGTLLSEQIKDHMANHNARL